MIGKLLFYIMIFLIGVSFGIYITLNFLPQETITITKLLPEIIK